jgi:hypothetical protein
MARYCDLIIFLQSFNPDGVYPLLSVNGKDTQPFSGLQITGHLPYASCRIY